MGLAVVDILCLLKTLLELTMLEGDVGGTSERVTREAFRGWL